MGLKGCQIILDNPWNTYYAGQTVNGKVVFTFDSPKKIRGKEIRNLLASYIYMRIYSYTAIQFFFIQYKKFRYIVV